MSPDIAARFWPKVDKNGPNGCWLWTAARQSSNGYGRFGISRGIVRFAHRVVWEMERGPIPDGYEIDHLCRNTSCVNPDHLEPVPPRTNKRRSLSWAGINARKTHCPKGHEYTAANTVVSKRGERSCRRCSTDASNQRGRDVRAKRRAERIAAGERTGPGILTWPLVREIRSRLAAGEKPAQIAPDYGVTPATVHELRYQRRWKESECCPSTADATTPEPHAA